MNEAASLEDTHFSVLLNKSFRRKWQRKTEEPSKNEMALQQSLAVFIMSKAKECAECGQGFAEDNSPVGGPISSTKCANGHVGPFNRITTTG